MTQTPNKKIVILGAGIVGLSLAWHLKKHSAEELDITLLEANSRVGGMIHTDWSSKALYEVGPHTLRLSHPFQETCMQLIEELGLKDELLYANDSMKKRYIGYDGQLFPFPMNPFKLLSLKNFRQIVLPLLRDSSKSLNDSKDPSIYDFFTRRYNSYITDNFIDPMVAGIFGGDLKKLSLKSCFPLINQLKDKNSSLFLALLKHKRKYPSQMISFKRGIASLSERIAERLNAKIILNTPVQALRWSKKPTVVVKGASYECDHIFSCLPSAPLYSLLKEEPLKHAHILPEINWVSFKVLHLGFKARLKIPKGFGFLTPSWKNEMIAGVLFDSSIFPEQNSIEHATRLTVLIHERSTLYSLSDEEVIKGALSELTKYLKCGLNPSFQKIHTVSKAIPQYEIGHAEKLKLFREELKEKLPHFSFTGSSFYGTAVPSCIQQGRDEAIRYLSEKSYTAC